jgi:predicted mannosyl-3-phosphoglycerate phosphatase (HAD superfamily)
MNIHDRPATIFCDIDGTLVKHAHPDEAAKPLQRGEKNLCANKLLDN